MALHPLAGARCRSFVSTSPRSSRFLRPGVAASGLIPLAAPYLPFPRSLLRVEPLDAGSGLRIAAVGPSIVPAGELHERLRPPPPDARAPEPGR